MNNLVVDRLNELFNETLPFVLDDQQYSFIKSLPSKQRICFLLRNAYSYSYKQIAETLDISEDTAKRNVSHAQAKCNKSNLK